MAARKKSASNVRSRKVETKTVSSSTRSRAADNRAAVKPAQAGGAAAGATGPVPRHPEAETTKPVKPPATETRSPSIPVDASPRPRSARAKAGTDETKTMTREATLPVDPNPSGRTKTPQPVKAQAVHEELALKSEKAGAAGMSEIMAQEAVMPPASASAPSKAAGSSPKQKPVPKDDPASAAKALKASGQRQGFKLNEFVVYPAHGVGQIVSIEEQEVAGFKLELFVISFSKDKMTLRVPTSKVVGVGMRKISDPDTVKRSLDILAGRARVKRTMWSRRAQEYETKINSGDIAAIAEVVRDLYRSDAQPEQSYSERQLYEAALDRMVREIAAVQKSNEIDALKAIESQLQKTSARQAKAGSADVVDPEIEEAA